MLKLRYIMMMICCIAAVHVVHASGGETIKKDAVIYGYVVDAATRKPVAGVTVSAASPRHGVNKEVATDADGFFKFKQLPSGELSLQFDKKGYRNMRMGSVAVKEGIVTKLTVEVYSEKTSAESVVEFEHPVLRLVDGIW
jgi:Carboxypeptidase regulatory-like domain